MPNKRIFLTDLHRIAGIPTGATVHDYHWEEEALRIEYEEPSRIFLVTEKRAGDVRIRDAFTNSEAARKFVDDRSMSDDETEFDIHVTKLLDAAPEFQP